MRIFSNLRTRAFLSNLTLWSYNISYALENPVCLPVFLRCPSSLPVRRSYLWKRQWRPIWLWDVEAHRLRWNQSYAPAVLNPRNTPGTHFFRGRVHTRDLRAAGRVWSIEKSNYLIGNRTRDSLGCDIESGNIVTITKRQVSLDDYVGVLISFWLFLFAAQPKEFFLDGLKKLEQRSHKCVWSSRGNM
jgi:hypothetical protein